MSHDLLDIDRIIYEELRDFVNNQTMISSDGCFKFECVELVRDNPVSYTHLDVYKRQVHAHASPDGEDNGNLRMG